MRIQYDKYSPEIGDYGAWSECVIASVFITKWHYSDYY